MINTRTSDQISSNFLFTTKDRTRVAEVVRGHGGPPSKGLELDENFKPEHMLFCRELRFVAICAHFGDLWPKKCHFGSKTVFLRQGKARRCTMTWYILHILLS